MYTIGVGGVSILFGGVFYCMREGGLFWGDSLLYVFSLVHIYSNFKMGVLLIFFVGGRPTFYMGEHFEEEGYLSSWSGRSFASECDLGFYQA